MLRIRRLVSFVTILGVAVASVAPAGALTHHGAKKRAAHKPAHSLAHQRRPHVALAVPTNFQVVAGDSRAAFTWSPVSGATRYFVVAKPNNASCVVTTTSCVVSGLVNGTTYTATMYAADTTGMSPSAVPVTFTPQATAPTAPTGVIVAAFGLHVRVMWQPSFSASSPVTSYTVTSSPAGAACTTASTSCTVTDLVAGTSYTFSVTATNASGTSVASAPSSSVTVTDRPGAPTNLVAVAAPNSIGVTFDGPASDGGAPIDYYTVIAFLASTGQYVTRCHADAPDTSCTLSGLATTTAYVIRVMSHNETGFSIGTTLDAPVTTGFNVPGAPLDPAVTAGPESIDVRWSVPVSDGGGAITGYTAAADDGKGGVFTCTSKITSCTISGLTDGVTYSVTVFASNGAGDSPSTTALDATPGNVPGAPSITTATSGDRSIEVSWTAPSSDGGSTILGYTATADDGSGHTFRCTSATSSCIISGLTNGTAYTVSVVATNITGDSLASTSTTSTPVAVAAAPSISSVTSGNGSLAITWNAPLNDGGSTVLGYVATVDDGDGGTFTCETANLTCTITGLTNGTTYTVTVVATNAIGSSVASTSASGTPSTTPNAPTDVVVTAGDGALTVSWSASVGDGGSVITGYTVSAGDGENEPVTCVVSASTFECLVKGLTNGVTYTVTVVATNAVGDSVSSTSATGTPVLPTTVPGAPGGVTINASDGALTVNWVIPNDGGSAITGFTAYAMDAMENLYSCTGTASDTSCEIVGLTNGVTYTITVIATNALGDSDSSTEATASPLTTPGTPTSIATSPLSGALTIYWSAPESNGGSPITGYTAYAYDPSGNQVGSCVVDGETFSCVIHGLQNFVTHSITVIATNLAGDSPASVAPNVVNPNVILGIGTGWLAFSNWDGFVSSDPAVTDLLSSATYITTYDFDCYITDILAGPKGGVYVQNQCGAIFYIASDGTVTGLGYNIWGGGYQMAIGPNGEAVFATDNSFIRMYNYALGQWENKYLSGGDCIDGVTLDNEGRVWVSDMCRGQIGLVLNNVFDGVDGGSYDVNWMGDFCSPYRLSVDSNDILYIGSDCWGRYSTYDISADSFNTYTGLDGYLARVYGVGGVTLLLDTDPWPHRFLVAGASGMPQSAEPTAPVSAETYTWGDTWVQARWSAPEYQGLAGPITNYTVTVTGVEGDTHTCSTNQTGVLYYDSGYYTCTVTGLINGGDYSISVVATNVAGNSPAAAIGSFTTMQPTITVPNDIGTVGASGNYTMITSSSASGSQITVSNLPSNWMVTVYAVNGNLSIAAGRWSNPMYETWYWGNNRVMQFGGSASDINHDLAYLQVSGIDASQPTTLFAVATPNTVIYNPNNGHYYQVLANSGNFSDVLSRAESQTLLGMQGYLATPISQIDYTYLYGIKQSFYLGLSDDPNFITDPKSGAPLYAYLFSNDDPSTSWTADYQVDSAASFQRWYIVSGPHKGEQFANGGMLWGPGGGTDVTGYGANGYTPAFCPNEPNASGLNETVVMSASTTCYNDISRGARAGAFVEYGGTSSDALSGYLQSSGSTSFASSLPVTSAPRSLFMSTSGSTFYVNWTEPTNRWAVGLWYYYMDIYRQNADGSETLVCGSIFVYQWSTQWSPGCMSYPNTYRIVLAGYNGYGRGAEGSVLFTPPNLAPHAVTNFEMSGNQVAGIYATWTAPDNVNDVGLDHYVITTYKQNADGTETATWSSWYWSWATSSWLSGMSFPDTYRVEIVAYNWNGSSATSVTFSPNDPYTKITNLALSVYGNAVTGTWTSTEPVGGMWFAQMKIYAKDGTYITSCTTYQGPGENTCWVGGLDANTEYDVVVQGYGWWTGMGGGASTTVTTEKDYQPSNYHAFATTPTYPNTTVVATDDALWYSTGAIVTRVLNGIVQSQTDVSSVLPADVGIGGAVALPNGGVAYYTTGYNSGGWMNTGILVVAVDGTASYLADGATNCAHSITTYGEDSVVVSNFFGLIVINYLSGESYVLPGTTQWEYMYSTLVPSNDGQIYFLDRFDNSLLRRYDGVDAGGAIMLTTVSVGGIDWQGVQIVDGYYYNYDYNPSYNHYTVLKTSIADGTSVLFADYSATINAPNLVGFFTDGRLLARNGTELYSIYTAVSS